ncbi:hypothetical protein K3495_g4961 [Podosphaera aphanis]|nr:hypothetical protein K3495_g4961 [Podosphaera aphanis]
MADLEEDALFSRNESQFQQDNDPTDETQDFRFLAALASLKSGSQLPKRGEKDFEPHGTKHQENILESSRQAMHDALSYTRFHTHKNHVRGFYYGDESMRRDDTFPPELRQGLEDDHIVLVESPKGPHFKTMGKMTTGQKVPALWLLPEEALYLVERGFLDLWWPTEAISNDTTNIDSDFKNNLRNEGIPMSLQAAYAMLIGNNDENGKVSMDRYTVYGNLRRTGYVVQRAPDWDTSKNGRLQEKNIDPSSAPQVSLFNWLFGNFFAGKRYLQYGPLVSPGMYRSYTTIYRKIAVVPRHKPLEHLSGSASPPDDPYRVVFFLWKGDNLHNFTKKNPGLPDFRVAIVDAQSAPIPSLKQIIPLIESAPFDPPSSDSLKGPGKTYQRIKHGWRNITLAVIDQGVISYLKLAEGAFGEELMYERFDYGGVRGGKRGGYRGGGRAGRGGRGRGRR